MIAIYKEIDKLIFANKNEYGNIYKIELYKEKKLDKYKAKYNALLMKDK